MSDDAAGVATAEQGLQGSATEVASFDEPRAGFIRQLQGFLHQFPTMIPFVVLLIGVLIFSIAAGPKFFAILNLSLVLQQVTIIGVLSARSAGVSAPTHRRWSSSPPASTSPSAPS